MALLALAGFVIAVTLILKTDAAAIARNVMSVGWGLLAILSFHVFVMTCDAAAWRAMLRGDGRGPLLLFVWARWVRESINTLLPVAQIGGEVVGARILALRSMPLRVAGA